MAGMMIGGIGAGPMTGPVTAPATAPRAGAGGRVGRASGFRLPDSRAGAAFEPEGAAGPTSVQDVPSLGLAALQDDGAPARDRRGAARAKELLRALSALQAGMLAGAFDPEALGGLAALAEGETPADPVLADALAGIALRARVEIARHGMRAGTAGTARPCRGPTCPAEPVASP